MIVFGIDPGMNATGYGVIMTTSDRHQVRTAGAIQPPKGRALAARLEFLHQALSKLINQQQPGAVVLEKLYTHASHVTTAARMAHARGVACLAAEQHQVPVFEYSPNRVKKAVTGHGTASKEQVARMVGQWIDRTDPTWSYDATDALALAIAHAQMTSRSVVVGGTS